MKSITYNLREYGAVGDGKTLDGEAIEAAIQACSTAGGGTVVIPSGQYLTTPFELLSNVTLHLEAGAVIQASDNLADYPSEPEGSLVEWYRVGLVSAHEAVNVAIEGYGMVDGSGMSFVYQDRFKYNNDQGSDFAKRYTRQGEDFLHDRWDQHESPYQAPPAQERPGNVIRFHKCQHVRLSNITVANSPSWTILIDESQDVTIAGLHIHSKDSDRRVPNDDGIDILHSRDVHISNCTIETGDDCIAIFAGQDITVSNCTLHSRSAGIRVGWMWGDIRNCTFQNLTIESNRGICICVRGKYSITNIMFSHIILRTQFKAGHWWGNGEPVQISALPMYADQTELGQIRNVSLSHLIAESTNGIVVYGCEQSIIQNVTFDGIQLALRNDHLQEAKGGNFDLRGHSNLEKSIFEHDIPSIYCQFVDGIDLRNISLEFDSELPQYYTNGIYFQSVQGATVEGLRGSTSAETAPVIEIQKSSNITIGRSNKSANMSNILIKHD